MRKLKREKRQRAFKAWVLAIMCGLGLFLALRGIIWFASYDFCPLYYNIKCL